MAKKKAGPNRSQLIRDYLAKHPNAANKDVAAEVSKAGVKTTGQYVSVVKASLKKKAAKGRSTKGAARKASKPLAASRNLDIEAVLAAKELVDQHGAENVKDAIDLIEKIS